MSLEGYDDFFADMKKAFPIEYMASRGGIAPQAKLAEASLVVHDVGDFEASFVPTVGDFARLDERFRFSPDVWKQLPQYEDWGFAVFKLRSGEKPGIIDRLRGR